MTRRENTEKTGQPGPDKGQAFGMAAVTQTFEGVHFPISKDELLAHVGDQNIEYYKGHYVNLRSVIEECQIEEFNSPTEIVQAVKDIVDRESRKAA